MSPTHSPDWIALIQSATSFRQLGLVRRELLRRPDVINLDSAEPAAPLQLLHDALFKQAVALALRACTQRGMGNPPVPYVILAFGSSGRMEQAQISDQDNGLVYQLPADISQHERQELDTYFAHLTATLVRGLAEAGYPECSGGVVCTNPRWRGPLQQWQTMYDSWAQEPSWEHVRYLLLCADARPVCGDVRLYEQLRDHYQQLLTNNPHLFHRMLHNTLYHRVPLNVFGRIRKELRGPYQGAINVKYGVYLPYVNNIRLWVIASGIRKTNSLERISALRATGIWPHDFCDEVAQQFVNILRLRLLPPQQWPDGPYESYSYLKPEALPGGAETLKSIIKTVRRLQKRTKQRFADPSGIPGNTGWLR